MKGIVFATVMATAQGFGSVTGKAPEPSPEFSVPVAQAQPSTVEMGFEAPECSELMCMMECFNGYLEDANGCLTCACAPSPAPACNEIMCMMFCEQGFEVDENGCELCSCVAPTPGSYIRSQGYCSATGGSIVNEGETLEGEMDIESCQAICDANPMCVAYQYDFASPTGSCWTHTSQRVEGGTGNDPRWEPGVCYVKA